MSSDAYNVHQGDGYPETPAEIARLLRWRQNRGELTLTQAIHICEKPWRYADDFRLMVREELAGDWADMREQLDEIRRERASEVTA